PTDGGFIGNIHSDRRRPIEPRSGEGQLSWSALLDAERIGSRHAGEIADSQTVGEVATPLEPDIADLDQVFSGILKRVSQAGTLKANVTSAAFFPLSGTSAAKLASVGKLDQTWVAPARLPPRILMGSVCPGITACGAVALIAGICAHAALADRQLATPIRTCRVLANLISRLLIPSCAVPRLRGRGANGQTLLVAAT